MNVLVIGSGGRENAICWKLQQSSRVATVYAFPGSEAISQLPKTKCVNGLNLKDFKVCKTSIFSRIFRTLK
jgi:phosphoribosylamine-glycine ligase